MRKLHLSKTDRKLLGVCGGIGETYGIDPTLILMVIFAALVTAIIPTVLMYIIAYFIIPDKPVDAN